MGPCPHLQASLCLYLCPLPLVPMSSFPGALAMADTQHPHKGASRVVVFCEQDCLEQRGTFVQTASMSPVDLGHCGTVSKVHRPAAQGLALRQGLSSVLKRAGWGVGVSWGSLSLTFMLGKGRDANRL